MSARRDRILAEIGVRPLWRLRNRGGRAAPPVPIPDPVSVARAARASDGPELELDDRAARIARMEWPALKSAVATCEACGLCKTRTNTVFGVGDERAEWVMLARFALGAEEDARGEPFVGQAGRLLDSMLAAVALRRGENVYIANVLKNAGRPATGTPSRSRSRNAARTSSGKSS